ncbi:MAG: ABC transporter permease subunit [Phycisphaeraceae bacterium]|nr:ABC transporter permease subunit [Phycisphaeraceae bacterium]
MPAMLRWLLYLGPTNPITVRLVQNGSRRARHFYIRTVYLAVLIVVLLWALVAETGAGDLDYRLLAQAGAKSFTWIANLQILLICLLAPVFMAGAIAQEANPKTWDILLTTPLTPAHVVLGNLLGRLFFVLALLVASLPLFALTQYFGGVPGSSILASYAIAACAAVLVGAIAIALSVSRVVGKRAVFTFYIGVVTYLAITWSVDAWLQRSERGVTFLTSVNPFLALKALLHPANYPRAADGAAWMLRHPVSAWCGLSLGLSGFLIVASSLTVRVGGVQGLLAGGEGGIPWYRRLFGLGAAGAEHRPPRTVWHNPIAWREAAARNATLGRILARWAFIAVGGAFGAGLVVLYHTQALNSESFRFVLMATVWGEVAVIALVAVNMAATAVTREREDGTLDLLLTTPITPSMYLSGKLRGMVAYLLPMLAVPTGTMMLAGGYVAFGGLGRPDGVIVSSTISLNQTMDLPVVLPEAALAMPLLCIPFIAFCGMVGLAWSLKSKGTLNAVLATFGVVGVIAGTFGLCGWKAGAEIELVGPALAGMNPASLVYALIDPAGALRKSLDGGTSSGARAGLMIGAVIGAAIYLAAVYAIHMSMVRSFDVTTRRLAGTR